MSDANPIVEWRDVQGFPGYQVSNQGEVRSQPVPGNHLNVITLKQEAGLGGYLRVRLYRNKTVHRFLVHRLVLEAFVGPCPPDKRVCRHIDNNPQNNRVGNLAWATDKENNADKERHGTLRRGDRHHASILNESQVREIKAMLTSGMGQTAIGNRFGVSLHVIDSIKRNKCWKWVA